MRVDSVTSLTWATEPIYLMNEILNLPACRESYLLRNLILNNLYWQESQFKEMISLFHLIGWMRRRSSSYFTLYPEPIFASLLFIPELFLNKVKLCQWVCFFLLLERLNSRWMRRESKKRDDLSFSYFFSFTYGLFSSSLILNHLYLTDPP